MKFQSYKATPSLGSYPVCERFAVWRAAHKQLMCEDSAYRKEYQAYVVRTVCVALVPLSSNFVPPGWPLAISLSPSVLASVVGSLYLAIRQQEFMNRRIGAVLQRQA